MSTRFRIRKEASFQSIDDAVKMKVREQSLRQSCESGAGSFVRISDPSCVLRAAVIHAGQARYGPHQANCGGSGASGSGRMLSVPSQKDKSLSRNSSTGM